MSFDIRQVNIDILSCNPFSGLRRRFHFSGLFLTFQVVPTLNLFLKIEGPLTKEWGLPKKWKIVSAADLDWNLIHPWHPGTVAMECKHKNTYHAQKVSSKAPPAILGHFTQTGPIYNPNVVFVYNNDAHEKLHQFLLNAGNRATKAPCSLSRTAIPIKING